MFAAYHLPSGSHVYRVRISTTALAITITPHGYGWGLTGSLAKGYFALRLGRLGVSLLLNLH